MRMAQNATGQRAMPQAHWKAPPTPAFFEIESPSAPPTTISRKMPAVVIPLVTTRRIAIPRTFQKGRVSGRSYARLTALITEVIAPLATQTAPKKPIRNDVVEQVEEAQRADEKSDGGEEGEQRAVGDLLGETHAIVLHERREAAPDCGKPFGRSQLLRRARDVPGAGLSISRGRQCGSGR